MSRWNGFKGVGEKTDGGWLYRCDGMPTVMGCGAQVTITVPYARVGKKSTGWLVTYGLADPESTTNADSKGNDLDVVLVFCPSCAKVVEEQDKRRGG